MQVLACISICRVSGNALTRFTSRSKTQCKLCVGRIKLVRNKKQIAVWHFLDHRACSPHSTKLPEAPSKIICWLTPCDVALVLQVKNMRKEIADLLRASKQENARIRVETVIRENLLLQAFEVLELFLELLAVRVQLVEKSKDMPPDMIEALSSLVYSASRLQVGYLSSDLLVCSGLDCLLLSQHLEQLIRPTSCALAASLLLNC